MLACMAIGPCNSCGRPNYAAASGYDQEALVITAFLTPDPQGTPPAAAPLGTDEQTPTSPDEGGLERPGQGRQISRDAE